MKLFLAACALVLGAVLFIPKVHESLPEGSLKRVVELPGMAVSRIDLGSMDPGTLIVAAGILLLVVMGGYGILSR